MREGRTLQRRHQGVLHDVGEIERYAREADRDLALVSAHNLTTEPQPFSSTTIEVQLDLDMFSGPAAGLTLDQSHEHATARDIRKPTPRGLMTVHDHAAVGDNPYLLAAID